MADVLEWVSAGAAVVAATGGVSIWASALRTRWRLRIEEARAERARQETDQARRENEIHRRRFEEVWTWAHNYPSGPDNDRAWRWYGWWVGDPPGGAIGAHADDPGEAYQHYFGWLAACAYGGEPQQNRNWPRLPACDPPLAWLDEQSRQDAGDR